MGENIRDTIRERVQLGHTKNDIVSSLTSVGYLPKEVETAFAEVVNDKKVKPFDPDQIPVVVHEDIVSDSNDNKAILNGAVPITQHPHFFRVIVIVLLVVAALLVAGLVYWFFSNKP